MEKAVTFVKHGSDILKMEIKHMHTIHKIPSHTQPCIFYLDKTEISHYHTNELLSSNTFYFPKLVIYKIPTILTIALVTDY
jgi:hypothetical protein